MDEDGTPVRGMGGSVGPGIVNMIKPQAQQPVFLIIIENREHCKLHHKYNEWLTKYEEE